MRAAFFWTAVPNRPLTPSNCHCSALKSTHSSRSFRPSPVERNRSKARLKNPREFLSFCPCKFQRALKQKSHLLQRQRKRLVLLWGREGGSESERERERRRRRRRRRNFDLLVLNNQRRYHNYSSGLHQSSIWPWSWARSHH